LDLLGNRMDWNSNKGDIGIRIKTGPSDHLAAFGLSNTGNIKIIASNNPTPISQGDT
jgi:hypothetical protein